MSRGESISIEVVKLAADSSEIGIPRDRGVFIINEVLPVPPTVTPFASSSPVCASLTVISAPHMLVPRNLASFVFTCTVISVEMAIADADISKVKNTPISMVFVFMRANLCIDPVCGFLGGN
jgi:hypothetical protein